MNTITKFNYTKPISTIKQYDINEFIDKRIENYREFQDKFTVSPDCHIIDIKKIKLNHDFYGLLETATPSASTLIFEIYDNLIIKIKYYFRSRDKEIDILKILTKKSIRKECPHFPIIYNYLDCNKDENKYSAIITEKADGDLNIFFKKYYKDYELIKNAIEQIIMSIYYFNILTGYNHNDCHFGNFLFFKIKEGGYLEYKINGQDYYIKNLGYLWIIWDFDYSSLNSSSKKIETKDIKRFIDNISENYINISRINTISDKILELIKNIENIKIYNNYDDLFINIKDYLYNQDIINSKNIYKDKDDDDDIYN